MKEKIFIAILKVVSQFIVVRYTNYPRSFHD